MSRSFGARTPIRPHLLRRGKGVGAEVGDVRVDVERAFTALEAEVDDLSGRVVALEAVPPEVLAGTSDDMSDEDHGKLIRCTSGSTVTITVPSGLTPGVTVQYLQEGAGQVQISAGGGMTLRHPATYNPYTNEQWSMLAVIILDSNEALVLGDLATV